MFDQLILSVIKEIVVPELASFIKHKFETTGTWPTKAELDTQADNIHLANKNRGEEFLNRNIKPANVGPEKLAFDDNGL